MNSRANFTSQVELCTPRELLQLILSKFIDLSWESLKKITLLNIQDNFFSFQQSEFGNSVILLKKTRHPTRLIYSSAIAHKLAARSQIPAIDLATKIAKMVFAFTLDHSRDCVHTRLPEVVLRNIDIQPTVSGSIQFEFRDPAIAYWLDALTQIPFANLPRTSRLVLLNPTPEFHKTIFAIQHAHARCCSLLRLAHQTHLSTLGQPEGDPNRWQFVVPSSIPWLTPDLQLCTSHATEQQLVNQLLATLDELGEHALAPKQGSSDTLNLTLQLATDVSQALQAVHRNIQMLGSSFRAQPSDRQHAHIGLILITQRLLHLLLQNWLGIHAPSEL